MYTKVRSSRFLARLLPRMSITNVAAAPTIDCMKNLQFARVQGWPVEHISLSKGYLGGIKEGVRPVSFVCSIWGALGSLQRLRRSPVCHSGLPAL